MRKRGVKYWYFIKSFKQILAENFAERGGGRRQAGACQDRQQSYAEFYAIDVKGFMEYQYQFSNRGKSPSELSAKAAAPYRSILSRVP